MFHSPSFLSETEFLKIRWFKFWASLFCWVTRLTWHPCWSVVLRTWREVLAHWRLGGPWEGRGVVGPCCGDGRIIISRLVTNNPTFVAERHRPFPNSLHAVPCRAAATRFKPTSAFNFSMKILPYWHITVQTIQPFKSWAYFVPGKLDWYQLRSKKIFLKRKDIVQRMLSP